MKARLTSIIGAAVFLFVIALGLTPATRGAGPEDKVVLVVSSEAPELLAVAAGFRGAFAGSFLEINLEGSDLKQKTVGESLQAAKPEVVVVVGDLAAQMAKWHLQGTPVIYSESPRAVQLQLTAEKTVGIYHEPDPLEQLRALNQLFPERKRVGLIYSPGNTPVNEQSILKEARGLGISLEIAALGTIEEVPVKLRELMPRIQVLWVLTDPVILSRHSKQFIVLESYSAGVPTFCGEGELAYGGATAGLVPDLEDAGKKAAREAGRTIRKTASAAGTIIYPEGKLVLNQKVAGLQKVSFPPPLLNRAELIQ